jgi:hypothetical protein
MTEIVNYGRPHPDHTLALDWRPAIERLREDARRARMQGRADPFAEVEAECWLDLVEAEIAAHKELDQSRPDVAFTLHQLRNWRLELKHLLDQLAGADSGTAPDTLSEVRSRLPLDARNSANQIINSPVAREWGRHVQGVTPLG